MRQKPAPALLSMALALAAQTASGAALPVVETMPSCAHAKLGTVAAVEGTDVSRGTKDIRVAPADYAAAFRKLGEAAAAKGANLLVLRGHQAQFFTKARGRSLRPVHVALRAAAVRVDDLAACPIEALAPEALQRRAIEGEAQEIIADPGAPTP